MKSMIERLKETMTYSEVALTKELIKEIGVETEKNVISSKITDAAGGTRSVLVTALRILEVAGVIETRSMGMKGTNVKVLDRDTLEQILNM